MLVYCVRTHTHPAPLPGDVDQKSRSPGLSSLVCRDDGTNMLRCVVLLNRDGPFEGGKKALRCFGIIWQGLKQLELIC